MLGRGGKWNAGEMWRPVGWGGETYFILGGEGWPLRGGDTYVIP